MPLSLGQNGRRDYVRCMSLQRSVMFALACERSAWQLARIEFAYRDPAWPARLLTSVLMVCEYLRVQCIDIGLTRSCFYPKPFAWEPIHDSVVKVLYESILPQTYKSGTSTMDASKWRYWDAFREIGHNTWPLAHTA